MDPKGTQLARKVVRGCHWCRRENVNMQTQLMAELPDKSLTQGKPFQFTALDFFGPFPIKDMVRGRRTLKYWGVVYTCLASRALAQYTCRQLPSYTDQVCRSVWRVREVLRRPWHTDPSRCKKAGKHHRKRSQKDTVGVHSHGVQLEKRSNRSNDKISKHTLAHILEKGGKNMDFHKREWERS